MLCRRSFLGVSALAVLSAGGAKGVSEALDFRIESFPVPIPNLPPALEGFRIVALSDFHLLPYTRIGFLKRAISAASGLNPDLVVLLGDFVDATVESIHELAPALAHLRARHGVMAVLGNHDHLQGAAVVAETLARNGIEVLSNRGILLPVGRVGIYVSGTDSLSGRFSLRQALEGHQPGVPSILLAHEPDVADEVAADGRVSLQLSGHSHGGQVRCGGIEQFLLPRGARKYAFGSYKIGELFLHTSRGLGTTGVPLRFGSEPEVTLLTLCASLDRVSVG
jgi:predicted MPP superfamily phosphohydrolase